MNDKVYFIMGINPCIWGLNYHNPSVVLILCSLRPLAVANAFFNGRYAEQNGRSYLVDC